MVGLAKSMVEEELAKVVGLETPRAAVGLAKVAELETPMEEVMERLEHSSYHLHNRRLQESK